MDVKEYISSGIIELYSMNALSPREMKEVEGMAAVHSEVEQEIERVQDSLDDYARVHARNPRPSLRAEIMDAIADSPETKKGKVIRMNAVPASRFRILVAACIVLVVVSTAISYALYRRWKDADFKYTALLNEKNVLANNFEQVNNAYHKTSADLTVVRNENAKIITLLSTDSTRHYMARVFWNRNTNDAYIDVLSLPPPGSGKQYQLWALVGGKPVDAGVFNMDTTNGMQKVKTVFNADAWAVTLEPMGGSASPTLTQMFLLSKS